MINQSGRYINIPFEDNLYCRQIQIEQQEAGQPVLFGSLYMGFDGGLN